MVKALLTWTADVSLVLGIAVLAVSVLLVPEVILLGQEELPFVTLAPCAGPPCDTGCAALPIPPGAVSGDKCGPAVVFCTAAVPPGNTCTGCECVVSRGSPPSCFCSL
jgi:hypothetical protein